MGTDNPALRILEHMKVLSGTTRNDPIPDRIRKDMQLFISWYEKEVKWACDKIEVVESSAKVFPSCSKGCNACCKLPIFVYGLEARAIVYYIKNYLSKSEKELIKSQVDNACAKISTLDNTPLKKLDDRFASIDWQKEYREQYFNAGILCPLVKEDGSCAVYPVRPTVCWSHKAYGNPSDCSNSPYVEHAFSYEGLQNVINYRILSITTKKKDRKLMLLPLALKELM